MCGILPLCVSALEFLKKKTLVRADLHVLEHKLSTLGRALGLCTGQGRQEPFPKPRLCLTMGFPSCVLAYFPYLCASSTIRSLSFRKSKAIWPSTIKYAIYLKKPQHVKFIFYLQKWSMNAFDIYLSKQINGN